MPEVVFFFYIYIDLESLRKPDLDKVYILFHKVQFILQRNEVFILAFDHIAVEGCQFLGVGACLLNLFINYQIIQHVEAVEKKVRVDLFLELEVAVLCHIGLVTLHLYFVPRSDGRVYYIYDADDCKFRDGGHDGNKPGFLVQQVFEDRRKPDFHNQGFKQDCCKDENEDKQGF